MTAMYTLRCVSTQFKSVISYPGQENLRRCGQLYFIHLIILPFVSAGILFMIMCLQKRLLRWIVS